MPAPTKSRTLALPSGGTGLPSAGHSRRPDSQGYVQGDDPSPKLHVSVSTSALNPFITLTSYKTLRGSQHAAPTLGGSNSSPATPTGASSSKPRSPYMVKPSHLQHASAERRCAVSKSGVREGTGRAPHPQECAHLSALTHVLQSHGWATCTSLKRLAPVLSLLPPRSGPSQGGVRDSLESIRDGIRRLHSALTSQPLGPAGAAATVRASGSGASG